MRRLFIALALGVVTSGHRSSPPSPGENNTIEDARFLDVLKRVARASAADRPRLVEEATRIRQHYCYRLTDQTLLQAYDVRCADHAERAVCFGFVLDYATVPPVSCL